MIIILIMLILMMEVILSIFVITSILRIRKKVNEANKLVFQMKQKTLKIIANYRISIRMTNLQAKRIKDELQIKKIFETLNSIASFLILFKLGKKRLCKQS